MISGELSAALLRLSPLVVAADSCGKIALIRSKEQLLCKVENTVKS